MIVKICGITSVDDALMALDAGADWVGLNLVAGPRKISLDAACGVVRELGEPGRAVVLLKLGEDYDQTDALERLGQVGVRRLQLYGAVTGEMIVFLRGEGFESVCVHPVGGAGCIEAFGAFLTACSERKPDFVVLDARDPTRLGGTGRPANWGVIVQARSAGVTETWPPIILAGGLAPDNVAEAIRVVGPAGVDVSSGVELSPGRKDEAKVLAFVRAAREA